MSDREHRTTPRRLTGLAAASTRTWTPAAPSTAAETPYSDSPTSAATTGGSGSGFVRGQNYGSFSQSEAVGGSAGGRRAAGGSGSGRLRSSSTANDHLEDVPPLPGTTGSSRTTPMRSSRRYTPSQEQLLQSSARSRPPGYGSNRLRGSNSRAASLFTLFGDAVGPTSPPHHDADLPPIDFNSSESSGSSSGCTSDDEREAGGMSYRNGGRDLVASAVSDAHPLSGPAVSSVTFDGRDDDDVPEDFGHDRRPTEDSDDPSRSLLSTASLSHLPAPPPDSPLVRTRSRSVSRARGDGEEDDDLPEKQYGVLKAEITSRRLRAKKTGLGLWVVYIGIYLLSLTLSVETNAVPVVEPFFLSLFGAHGLLSSVSIVTSIAYAVGKPPLAKIMDVFGRSEGVIVAAVFYFLGAMLTTSANNVAQYAVARTLAALGYQGLQLAQQIIVADTSTLASRALLTSTISSPWLITTWLGPWIGEAFKNAGETGYRAVYAVFGVVIPIFSLGLAGILWWEWRTILGRRKTVVGLHAPSSPSLGRSRRASLSSRRDGAISHGGRGRRVHSSSGARKSSPSPTGSTANKRSDEGSNLRRWSERSVVSLGKEAWTQMDVLGIALLTAGCSMLLLPLTLASRRPQSWADPKLYVLLFFAVVILGLFALYETRLSKCPIMPPRLLKERTIVAGSLLCFFHFLCQLIYESYFTSFLQVARFNTARDASYIAESYIFTACISALVCGLLVKWSCRYKIWVIVGILLHAVGAILMVRFRRLENPTWELVLSQVIAGAGGGFTTLGAQLGVQSVVSHQDVGIATAVFLTITQVGGAVGASIAGAVWTTLLPVQLERHLPAASHDRINDIVSNLNAALSFPRGSPERQGIIDAYIDVQRVLNLLSLAALLPCLVCAFRMKNVDLSNPPPVREEYRVVPDRDPEQCSLLEEGE